MTAVALPAGPLLDVAVKEILQFQSGGLSRASSWINSSSCRPRRLMPAAPARRPPRSNCANWCPPSPRVSTSGASQSICSAVIIFCSSIRGALSLSVRYAH